METRWSLTFLFMASFFGATPQGAWSGAVGSGARQEVVAAPWVSVTVSPLLTTSPKRQLELSWAHASPRAGDWVGLFDTDPLRVLAHNGSRGALAAVLVDGESGHALTGVGAPRETLEVTQCAAYVRPSEEGAAAVLSSWCARAFPDWMGNLSEQLSPLRLRQVLLPGTHDSGAFRIYSPSRPQTIVEKYSITQEEDIASQLLLGARYLDIRVGYYPSTSERWWLNHGVVRLHPLQDALDDLKDFIAAHPKEIIIFDVQEFPVGFGNGLSVHHDLVAYLSSELDDLLVPPSLGWGSTLRDVWAQRGRVILGYDRNDVINAEPTAPLWRSPKQLWGDVRTLDALRDYLHGLLGPGSSPQSGATAAMAELTPSAWDVVLDSLGGLRQMAADVNDEMTELLREEWAPRTNSFAVDFIRSTDVVRVAVEFNRQRGEALLARRRQRDTREEEPQRERLMVGEGEEELRAQAIKVLGKERKLNN